MKTTFHPTEEEAREFKRYKRGTIQRRIEPQPWKWGPDGDLWAWKRPESKRKVDVAWVDGVSDDMLDAHCPHATRGMFWTSDRGLKIRAESVRAERLEDGWFWVILWRVA